MDGGQNDTPRVCELCGNVIERTVRGHPRTKYCLLCSPQNVREHKWRERAVRAERERDEALDLLSAMVCEDPRHRDKVRAPEDPAVQALCDRWGYGAVMDAAMRLWNRQYPGAAHTVCGSRSAAERAWKLLVRLGKDYRPS